jgi:hypothetical protein
MKFTAPHWVIAALVILGTLAPQIAAQFPALAPYCAVVTQLDPLVLGLFGVTTASAINSTNVTAVAKVAALKAAGPALVLLGLVGVAGSLTGCAGGVPTAQTQAVINASAALALCVETVVQHDESSTPPAPVTQVLMDEGLTCGPEAAALVTAIGQETNAANTAAAVANAHAGVMARRAAKGR